VQIATRGEKYEFNLNYIKALQTLPVDIYFTGDIENSKIIELSEKFKKLERTNVKNIGIGEIDKNIQDVKNITEKMNVNQGKLTMGFRTYTAPGSQEYYALMVYSTVLGGGMHSKLFQNVREKASLAYYAFSRLEKFKGLMVISSGIESENRDKAIKIIKQQLEDITQGNITDYEYDSTLKSIETGIKSLKDSQLQMVDFYMSQDLTGQGDNFDTMVEKVKKVTKEDIVAAAKKIKLDTVYFLTSA
jgi:predicted Zn-dependent peptidase